MTNFGRSCSKVGYICNQKLINKYAQRRNKWVGLYQGNNEINMEQKYMNDDLQDWLQIRKHNDYWKQCIGKE